VIDFDCMHKAAWRPFAGNAKFCLKMAPPQIKAKIPSLRQLKAVCNTDLIKQRPVLNLKNRSWPWSTWQDKGGRESRSCSNMRRHCVCRLGIGKSVPKIVCSVTDLVQRAWRSCASSFRTDMSTTYWARESHHEKKVRGEIR